MIQRIQSIYLFLAAIFMGGLFLQSADLITIDTSTPTALAEMEYYKDKILDIYDQNLLIAFALIVAIFAVISIFLFKKRKLQITLSRVAMLVVLLFLIMTIYVSYADLANVMSSINVMPGYGIFLPFLTIVVLILAVRNIKKDDKLVKSMDRLR
ncbi:MAG: DUF4293 domain-containing protein [Sphaerochaetaceae bacterium]